MMLESNSTAGINITQGVPCGGCPIETSFVLRKRLENNAANEDKIRRWFSQLGQNRMIPSLAGSSLEIKEQFFTRLG